MCDRDGPRTNAPTAVTTYRTRTHNHTYTPRAQCRELRNADRQLKHATGARTAIAKPAPKPRAVQPQVVAWSCRALGWCSITAAPDSICKHTLTQPVSTIPPPPSTIRNR
eukprot:3669372-Prymnesium_polylepis.2